MLESIVGAVLDLPITFGPTVAGRVAGALQAKAKPATEEDIAETVRAVSQQGGIEGEVEGPGIVPVAGVPHVEGAAANEGLVRSQLGIVQSHMDSQRTGKMRQNQA